MHDKTRQDCEAQIIAKAWKDEAFRQRLLADPKAVYGEELAKIQPGATLPATLNIQVVEETPTTLYLVLPVNPDTTERVLTEEELEAVTERVLTEEELEAVAGGLKAFDPSATAAIQGIK